MDSRSNEAPKHTPGPWEYHIMPLSGYIVFQTWDVPTAGYVKTEADAQLIAAAPEMLEALKCIVDTVWFDRLDTELILTVEHAIAKAEGRTP